MRVAIVAAGVVAASALAGCGGSGHHTGKAAVSSPGTTPVTSSALQACLEQKGYDVTPIDLSHPVPSAVEGLYASFTQAGAFASTPFFIAGGSPGKGDASVAIEFNPGEAQRVAQAAQSRAEQDGMGGVQTGGRGDVAWFAWVDSANTSNDVSVCAA
jgi:hypothetical protein